MGRSMVIILSLSPFQAPEKNSVAQKNKTGKESRKINNRNRIARSCSTNCPPLKYSGSENIIILAKQKPAIPIFNTRFLLGSWIPSLRSWISNFGSYPMEVNSSTNCRRLIFFESNTKNNSLVEKFTRLLMIPSLSLNKFSNNQMHELQCIWGM